MKTTKILPSVQELRFSKSQRIYKRDQEPRQLFTVRAIGYKIASRFLQFICKQQSSTHSNINIAMQNAVNNFPKMPVSSESLKKLKEAKKNLIEIQDLYGDTINNTVAVELSYLIDIAISQIVTQQNIAKLKVYKKVSLEHLREGINNDLPRSRHRMFNHQPIENLLPIKPTFDAKNAVFIAKDSNYLTKALMLNGFQDYAIFELGFISFDISKNGTLSGGDLKRTNEYSLIKETDTEVVLENYFTMTHEGNTLVMSSGEITISKSHLDDIFDLNVPEDTMISSPIVSIKVTDAYFSEELF